MPLTHIPTYPYPNGVKDSETREYLRKLYEALLNNHSVSQETSETTLRSRLPWIRPEDYGAKGDGTTNDTTALQASIDAVTDGGTWIGAGTYLTSSVLTIANLERATFYFNGTFINTTSSLLKLDTLVRCSIENIAVERSPYNWSPAHTGLEITGRFWNNKVSVRIIAGFEKGIHFNSDDANGMAWNEYHLQNIYDCKYGLFFQNTGSGWNNMNNYYGGAITLGLATGESGTIAVSAVDYGPYVFGSHNFYGLDIESYETGYKLDHCNQFNLFGARFEATDTWIYARTTYGLTIALSTTFDSSKVNLDDTCQGFVINGNNISEGGDYGAVAVDGVNGGLTLFDVADITNTKWRIYSDVSTAAGLKLSSPLGGNQVLNKQQNGTDIPTSGTFAVGAIVWNTTQTTGNVPGWSCYQLGTMGTLNSGNTTGSITIGTNALTVSSTTGIQRGQRLSVLSDAGGYAMDGRVVGYIVGNVVYFTTNAASTATGKAVMYFQALWKPLPSHYGTQRLLTSDAPQFTSVSLSDLATGEIPYRPAPTEILTDGAFELWDSATVPTNWTPHPSGPSSVNREGATQHGGTYCVRLDVGAANQEAYVQQEPTLTAYGRYELSGWYKTTGTATATVIMCDSTVTSFLQPDGSWANQPNQYNLAASAAWAPFSVSFQAPNYTSYILQLYRLSAASQSVYFDDVSLLEINPLDGSPLTTDGTNVINTGFYRTATSKYRRYYHLPLGSANPGGSGASFVDGGANTVGGWQLTAAGDILRGDTDIHGDWDGASDMKVEVRFQVNVNNAGGGVGDTVDLRIVARYMGVGDTAVKTQTVEVATVVGQSAQYKMFDAVFTLDWDAASNVIEAGDHLSVYLNLETDTSEVDNIIITGMSFSYLTTHIGVENGDE